MAKNMNTLVTFSDCVNSCDDMDEMQKKLFCGFEIIDFGELCMF